VPPIDLTQIKSGIPEASGSNVIQSRHAAMPKRSEYRRLDRIFMWLLSLPD